MSAVFSLFTDLVVSNFDKVGLAKTGAGEANGWIWSDRKEVGAVMMDAHEAIKGLDGYAEALLSLIALLNLYEKKSDEHQSLLVQIKQKQTDGRWIAHEIMKDLHSVGTKSDRSGDLTGISAAIERYVAADKQANEVLMKADEAAKPNATVEALRRFKLEQGLD